MSTIKTVIITGSNRGIGKETALEIAKARYRVILACRNMEKAESARQEIINKTGNKEIYAMLLDISSKKSILSFVDSFVREYGKVNVLVNNAGISTSDKKVTDDGYEINIGTNFIGTYLLTMNLLPYFDINAEKRIINLTSNIWTIGWFKTSKINKYKWFIAYAVSKRMIILFTKWLSAVKEKDNYKINAVHPGIVNTSIMYTGRWFDFIIKIICSPFFIDPKEGAKEVSRLILKESIGNGRYFQKDKEKKIKMTRKMKMELDDLLSFCRTI